MKLYWTVYVTVCLFVIVMSQKPGIKMRINRAALEKVVNGVVLYEMMKAPGDFFNLGSTTFEAGSNGMFQSSFTLNNVVATEATFTNDTEVRWDVGGPARIDTDITFRRLTLTGQWEYALTANGVALLTNSGSFVASLSGVRMLQGGETTVKDGRLSFLPPICAIENSPIFVEFDTGNDVMIAQQMFASLLRSQLREKICISFIKHASAMNDAYFLREPLIKPVVGFDDVIMDMTIIGDVTMDEHGAVLHINGRMKPMGSPDIDYDFEPGDLPDFAPPSGEIQVIEEGFHTNTLATTFYLTGRASGNITQTLVPKHLKALLNTVDALEIMPGLTRFGNREMLIMTRGTSSPVVTFDSDNYYSRMSLTMDMMVIMEDGSLENAMTMSSDILITFTLSTRGRRFFWRVTSVTGEMTQVSSNIGDVPVSSMNIMMSEQIGPAMTFGWNEYLLKNGYEFPAFFGNVGIDEMMYTRDNTKTEVIGVLGRR